MIALMVVLIAVACSSGAGEQNQAEHQLQLPEEFSALMDLYASPEDSLKYRAAAYLLEGLPRQWHYDVDFFDMTGRRKRVPDCEVIDVDYLAENIEYAFKAWDLPWCRDLSFGDFCRWILPYKMADEQPVKWRRELWEEYSWVLEVADSTSGTRDVCRMVNDSVNEWFTVNWDNPYQLDINFFQAKELKEAACYGASTMILYPLRALGVPAVLEGVPRWSTEVVRISGMPSMTRATYVHSTVLTGIRAYIKSSLWESAGCCSKCRKSGDVTTLRAGWT